MASAREVLLLPSQTLPGVARGAIGCSGGCWSERKQAATAPLWRWCCLAMTRCAWERGRGARLVNGQGLLNKQPPHMVHCLKRLASWTRSDSTCRSTRA
jgi:hypothetical protein